LAVAACLAASASHAGCKSSDSTGSGPDTDGDGLNDAEELNVYHTSPLDPDTDGDGLDDYKEVVTLGFDPNDNPFRYNPRVADVPVMAVVIANDPVVSIGYTEDNVNVGTITYSASQSQGWSETEGPTWAQAQSDTYSVAQTNGNDFTQSNTNDNTVSNTNDHSVSNTNDNSVSVTGDNSTTTGTGGSGDAGADAGTPPDAGADADAGDAGATDATTDAGGGGGGGGGGGASAVTNGNSVTTTNGNSTTNTNGNSITNSNGNSNTVALTNSVSTTVNPSTTFTTSYSYTDQMTRQITNTLSQDQSYAQSHGITLLGGAMRVTTIIENRSNLGFRVNDLVLTASLRTPSGDLIAVRGLNIDMGDFTTWQAFALGPGEKSGPTVFRTSTMSIDTTMALLQHVSEIDIELGVYELDDPTGKSYAFDSDAIGSRTALVVIDYGAMREPETYQVATDFVPGRPSVNAGTVFHEILQVPYAASTDTGLTGVRSIIVRSSGAVHWAIDRLHDTGPDVEDTQYGQDGRPYDFDGIELRAGDVLRVSLAGAGKGSALPGATHPLAPEGIGAVAGDGGLAPILDYPDADLAALDQPDGGSVPVMPGANGGFPAPP
jgi:hypothetical protein